MIFFIVDRDVTRSGYATWGRPKHYMGQNLKLQKCNSLEKLMIINQAFTALVTTGI